MYSVNPAKLIREHLVDLIDEQILEEVQFLMLEHRDYYTITKPAVEFNLDRLLD